jgi:uncharacterized protein YdeI (YjbR/CyaY-like superfamily)
MIDDLIERLRKTSNFLFDNDGYEQSKTADEAASRLAALQQRVEELEARERVLREALEPFAKIVDQHESGAWIWDISEPSLDDARRARAALTAHKDGAP